MIVMNYVRFREINDHSLMYVVFKLCIKRCVYFCFFKYKSEKVNYIPPLRLCNKYISLSKLYVLGVSIFIIFLRFSDRILELFR